MITLPYASARDAERPLVGRSLAMRQVRAEISRVAPQSTTVLLTGESGTGKELAARAIHERSPCRQGPFQPGAELLERVGVHVFFAQAVRWVRPFAIREFKLLRTHVAVS